MNSEHVTELFDKEGYIIGALLTAEAWNYVKKHLKLEGADGAAQEEVREPIEQWEMLLNYWDFQYEPDYDVKCGHCGNETENWKADEPRKFHLSAANLAGLVSFRCKNCQARVTKKHFKKEILTETTPVREGKDSRLEARY